MSFAESHGNRMPSIICFGFWFKFKHLCKLSPPLLFAATTLYFEYKIIFFVYISAFNCFAFEIWICSFSFLCSILSLWLNIINEIWNLNFISFFFLPSHHITVTSRQRDFYVIQNCLVWTFVRYEIRFVAVLCTDPVGLSEAHFVYSIWFRWFVMICM